MRTVLATGLIVTAAASSAAPAAGLPLFSRTTGAPCAECHSTLPQLNAVGIAFRQDGFRFRDPSGAALLASHGIPLSISGRAGYSLSRAPNTSAGVAAAIPRDESARHEGDLDLATAGTLGRRVTFQFEEHVESPREAAPTNAFLQLDDLRRDGALNLRAGVFELEAPYLSSSRRTTFADYRSPVTIAAHGVELNGAARGWWYGAGLIESQRHFVHPETEMQSLQRLDDRYLTLGGTVHGQMLDGRILFGRQDSDIPWHAWLQHIQAQTSALCEIGRLRLIPAYSLDRFDDRPAPGIHDHHHEFMLEAVMLLDPARRWVLTSRVEHDYHTRTVLTREEDHQREVLDVGYSVRANATASLEWSHASDNVGGRPRQQLDAFARFAY